MLEKLKYVRKAIQIQSPPQPTSLVKSKQQNALQKFSRE